MKKSFFPSGPFKEAEQNAENFAVGMYYNYCFSNTLEELLKIEEEYEEALASSDKNLIEAKKHELSFYESIVSMATGMLDKVALEKSGSLHD